MQTDEQNAVEPPTDELLTTGDMARLTESTLRTVRFYQEEGLIEAIARADGGHRHFHPRELRKLGLALHLREAGLSIANIKQLFGLKTESTSPKAASQDMTLLLQEQVVDLDSKIGKLERLRAELSEMVSRIANCEHCTPRNYPKRCEHCDVVEDPGLSRVVDVLWR